MAPKNYSLTISYKQRRQRRKKKSSLIFSSGGAWYVGAVQHNTDGFLVCLPLSGSPLLSIWWKNCSAKEWKSAHHLVRVAQSHTTASHLRVRKRKAENKRRGHTDSPSTHFGTCEDLKKKLKFRDVPLSNFDLMKWCRGHGIPIKGIYARNEVKPMHHSLCIINSDDFGSRGTHWVCCLRSKNGEYEYFD